VACRAKGSTAALAEQVAAALLENEGGEYDHLIAHLKDALKPEGLQQLRQMMEAQRPLRRRDVKQAVGEAASFDGDEEDEEAADGDGSIATPYFDGRDWLVHEDDFWNEDNVSACEKRGTGPHITTGRQKHGQPPQAICGPIPKGLDAIAEGFCEAVGRMARKLRKKEGREGGRSTPSARRSWSRCLVKPKQREGGGGFYCVGWRR
jgi:hypothetical protein